MVWTTGIKRTGQCIGHTAKGTRCKRKTARGDVCFMHLRGLGLQIKKSTIPDSGLGVYSTRARKKNDYLTNYKGEKAPAGIKIQGDYVLQQGSKYYDAKYSNSCVGRFLNDARGPKNNSRFSSGYKYPISIRATKPIKKGDELFIPYGKAYWKS